MSRIEKVRNREGKRRKERSGRETELKGRLKRWKTNGNGKETEVRS